MYHIHMQRVYREFMPIRPDCPTRQSFMKGKICCINGNPAWPVYFLLYANPKWSLPSLQPLRVRLSQSVLFDLQVPHWLPQKME